MHIVKMAEEAPEIVPTNPEKSEKAEELPEKAEKEETIDPAPKKRGRPAGSKDSAPRKPRVKIVEEPPTPPPEPVPDPPPEPAKKARVKQPVAETPPAPTAVAAAPPLSPRSVFRHASDHIATLQSQREQARKAYWMDAVSRTLR